MRKINEKVAGAFLEKKSAKGASISTDGATLWSYATRIAKWDGGRVIMDARKYSATTTRQQNDMLECARRRGIEVECVARNM